MAPSTPKSKPKRVERDTIQRNRFFEAYDHRGTTSLNSLCKRDDINIPPSTGRLWLRQREIQGSKATRRTRKQSSILGRKSKVTEAVLHTIMDRNNPLRFAPYEQQVEQLGLECQPRTLQYQCMVQKRAKRFKRRPIVKISNNNKQKRVSYGQQYKKKGVLKWWQYIYFTDEVHFNSADLAYKTQYELRQPGAPLSDQLQEKRQPSLKVTIHLAAGISYNHKGPLIFYNDPQEPSEHIYKPSRPRKSSVETDEQHQQAVEQWQQTTEHGAEIKPRGNAMTQIFYAINVLPHHIKHIQWLKEKYKHEIWFQEDGDSSHGHKSPKSAPTRLKNDSAINQLAHPPQSPDLNPIESVWQIMKQRLRGGTWNTVAEFKEAIEREWQRVTQAQIRRRIREMPIRCNKLINNNEERIRSNLW
jgi:transposase